MSIRVNLERILAIHHLAVSKRQHSKEKLSEWFVGDVGESCEYWLIPCSHVVHAPALGDQLVTLASSLGYDIPAQLQHLLGSTDGAELFKLHHRGGELGDYWIPRYRILSCTEISKINQELFDIFLSYTEDDQRFQDVERLNYIAFCDVGDGDYLGVTLEGCDVGSIFFLDHDYAYFPFEDEFTKDAYVHVANTLDEWLAALARTSGFEGMGDKLIPL